MSAIDKLLDALMRLRTLTLPGDPELGRDVLHRRADRRRRRAERHLAARHRPRSCSGPSDRPTTCCALLEPLEPLVEIEEVLRVPHVRLQTWAARPGGDRGVPVHDRHAAADGWGTPLLFGPGSFLVAHTAEEHLELAELEAAIGDYVRAGRTRASGTRSAGQSAAGS